MSVYDLYTLEDCREDIAILKARKTELELADEFYNKIFKTYNPDRFWGCGMLTDELEELKKRHDKIRRRLMYTIAELSMLNDRLKELREGFKSIECEYGPLTTSEIRTIITRDKEIKGTKL